MLWALLFIFKKLFRLAIVLLIVVVGFVIMNPSLWDDAKGFYADEIHPRVVTVVDYIDRSGSVVEKIPKDIEM